MRKNTTTITITTKARRNTVTRYPRGMNFRADERIYNEVKSMARVTNISMSDVMRTIIGNYFGICPLELPLDNKIINEEIYEKTIV